MITDQTKILAAQKSHQNLYTRSTSGDDPSIEQFLKEENIKCLDDTQKEMCEGLIMEEEVKEAIRSMKN